MNIGYFKESKKKSDSKIIFRFIFFSDSDSPRRKNQMSFFLVKYQMTFQLKKKLDEKKLKFYKITQKSDDFFSEKKSDDFLLIL